MLSNNCFGLEIIFHYQNFLYTGHKNPMPHPHEYFVYIMTNARNTVLYTGVTNNLMRRVWEHKNKTGSIFTSKYNINKLVYFEAGSDINQAIFREKQIKAGSRQKKIDLINSINPEWKDLSDEFFA
jgi:putative endonuclease